MQLKHLFIHTVDKYKLLLPGTNMQNVDMLYSITIFQPNYRITMGVDEECFRHKAEAE